MTLMIEAGLDSAIIDSTDRGLMKTMCATYAVLGIDAYCAQYSRAFRAGKIGPKLEERITDKNKPTKAATAPAPVSC
jgi:5-methyltetrahydrofolate--homocysteine methyltransferase